MRIAIATNANRATAMFTTGRSEAYVLAAAIVANAPNGVLARTGAIGRNALNAARAPNVASAANAAAHEKAVRASADRHAEERQRQSARGQP